MLAVSAVALDESATESAAHGYAVKLGVTLSPTFNARAIVTPELGTTYICTDGLHMFILSEAYQLKGYRNLERADEIRDGIGRTGGRSLANKAQAVAAAKQRALSLGYDPSQLHLAIYKEHAGGPSDNVNFRGRAFIQLEHRPGGYSAAGISGCAITLDLQDGTVIDLVRYFAWRLGPPDAVVSQSDAVSKAKQVMAGHASGADQAVRATYLRYVRPNGNFGSTLGDSLHRQRIARLAYEVVFDGYRVLIDSITGECLGAHVRETP